MAGVNDLPCADRQCAHPFGEHAKTDNISATGTVSALVPQWLHARPFKSLRLPVLRLGALRGRSRPRLVRLQGGLHRHRRQRS
jgi:hypothetical protein